jgi:lipopolysaccharide export LptBFGC system permease protein LptF
MSELEDLTNEYTFFLALKYVLGITPSNANTFLEGACLLGVMISLGISHQEGNLNVLRSSGESPLKIIFISLSGPLLLVFLYLVSNEFYFKDIQSNSHIQKTLISGSGKKTEDKINWIKDRDSFLSYSLIKDSVIYNVKFLKTDDKEVLYYKMSDSASISGNKITFDKTLKYHSYNQESEDLNTEIFNLPLVIKIPFKNIDNLKIVEVYNIYKLIDYSELNQDTLFKSHIEKALYKNIFYPFSIICLILFFGSSIFGSLRDASPASRIVLSVVGAFIYKILQDFTISFSIATNLSVLIGVVAPASLLLLMSIVSYRKI